MDDDTERLTEPKAHLEDIGSMIRLTLEHPHCEVAKALIVGLNDDILSRYPDLPSDVNEACAEQNLLAPDMHFFVAWRGDDVVGCGALRGLDDNAMEVKRMYVVPEARR